MKSEGIKMTTTLSRTSGFVLEVLPLVLSVLIGIFILSGYLQSWAHASEVPIKPAVSPSFNPGSEYAAPVRMAS